MGVFLSLPLPFLPTKPKLGFPVLVYPPLWPRKQHARELATPPPGTADEPLLILAWKGQKGAILKELLSYKWEPITSMESDQSEEYFLPEADGRGQGELPLPAGASTQSPLVFRHEEIEKLKAG